MEFDDNTDVARCSGNANKNIQDAGNGNSDQLSRMDSHFLKASELFSIRGNSCKNKNNEEDLELYKGPKMYYINESTVTDEIVEGILQDNMKSSELQRAAKGRDCLKAEWNDELKVAVVPHLKGKSSQFVGVHVKGHYALSPQEALFLLEKNFIEVERNNMPLSAEEAYSVMLKGKLSVEKYEVYSFLSQQGFVVVHHQSRIGPSYEQLINLTKKKHRKRKASDDGPSELPEQKRLTFTGVLASNSETNSFNAESSILSNDSVINCNESQNKVQSPSQDTFNSNQNITDTLQNSEKLISDPSVSISPDSTNQIESEDSTEKDVHTSDLVQIKDDNVKIVNDESPSKGKENSLSMKVSNENLTDKPEHNGQDLEMVIENTNENDEIDVENANEEIDVENANDEDTYEVIIEDEQKLDKSDDINVDDSLSDCYDIDEFAQSDESIPEVCEETNEKSLDVYSCSDDHQSIGAINSETDNVQSGTSKDLDDDVTLLEVKKKETKPLAVIDLLSDEDDYSFSEQKNKKSSSVTGVLPEDQEDKTNGKEMFEDSDDEIQVLKVCPVQTNSTQTSSKNINSIKTESKKFKIPLSSNVKSSFHPQMKFPDLCKKEIMCLPCPPLNLLPNHVQPAKEVYVINHKRGALPKQGRVWNSFRDMQEYQRDRRRERHSNSSNARPPGSFRDFRSQNDSFSNQLPHFNSSDNSRDFAFDRNNQGYPVQPNRNFNPMLPMNHDRSGAILPIPDAFNSSNRAPLMNMHELQNLSCSNPIAFVNEIQKTVYSVASSMLSTMLGQRLNPNMTPARSSPTFNEAMMNFNPHPHFNNFSQSPSPFQSPGVPEPMALNPAIRRNDFHPMRFQQDPSFSGERYPPPVNNQFMPENNWRPFQNPRPRNFPPPKGPLFPCTYRDVRRKRDWSDVKAAVVGLNGSDSSSDIEEVPINLNQFLWSNDIKPLVKPGSKLPVSEVLKSLQITQMANLCDTKPSNDRYLPSTPSLEISFDVYLPNSKYKRSAPSVPKYRVIVLRAADPIPKYSELVFLKRKWNDEASIQLAVVDHGDISFYSFNSSSVPEIIPFES